MHFQSLLKTQPVSNSASFLLQDRRAEQAELQQGHPAPEAARADAVHAGQDQAPLVRQPVAHEAAAAVPTAAAAAGQDAQSKLGNQVSLLKCTICNYLIECSVM